MIERKIAKLLEGTSDAAFAVNLQGEVLTWNTAAEKLFGYSAVQAVGRPCGDMIGGRSDASSAVCRDSCDILECTRTGRAMPSFEMEIRNRAGDPVWVSVSLLVAENERTGKRLAVHLMRDISDRRRTEQLTTKILSLARELVNENLDSAGSMPPAMPLTPREKEILGLMAAGKSTAEATRELKISTPTLRNHFYHINQKLRTRSRIQAVVQAQKRGLI